MGGVSDTADPTHSLLALYEFEAKLKLGHHDLDNVLEQIAKLGMVEPKTYETIAALCVRSLESAQCLSVGKNALRTAVRCHLQASPVDGERLRYAGVTHTLATLAIYHLVIIHSPVRSYPDLLTRTQTLYVIYS